MLKDLALYPTMRIIFRPPARTQPIGKRGEVVEALAPTGYIRVDGELWKATAPASGPPLPAGRQVVVRAAEGLTLLVDDVSQRAADERPQAWSGTRAT